MSQWYAPSLYTIPIQLSQARLFGVSEITLRSLMPKSITTPIAMGVSERVGGLPSLTAVLVILTGIIGASAVREVLDLFRVRDQSIRDFAIGVSSHGRAPRGRFNCTPKPGRFPTWQ